MKNKDLEIISEEKIEKLALKKYQVLEKVTGRRIILCTLSSMYIGGMLSMFSLDTLFIQTHGAFCIPVVLLALLDCRYIKDTIKSKEEARKLKNQISLLKQMQTELKAGVNRFADVPVESFNKSFEELYDVRKSSYFYGTCKKCGSGKNEFGCPSCNTKDIKVKKLMK